MSENLNEKQKTFCREFLKDFNATQAAIRAGYSERTARAIGSENLTKPDIQHYTQKLASEMNDRTSNDIEKIITELQIIAFGSLKDVADWNADGLYLKDSGNLEDKARIVSEVSENRTEKSTSLKIKMHDKLKALELLGRYHKIFTDKIEVIDLSKISDDDLLSKTKAIAGKLSEPPKT